MVVNRFIASSLAILTLVLSANPASSQKVVASENWQETVQNLCISTIDCAFDFSGVPTGKYLIVTHVTCAFSVTTAGTGFASVALIRKNQNGILPGPKIDLSPTKIGEVASTIQWWNINNQVSHIVKAGQSPRIEATLANTASASFYGGHYQTCTIVGTLTGIT